MAENIRAGRNFGFLENRSAKLAGTNAKLSEYGAAVGLAALDCWKETRLSTHAVAQCYFDIFSECMGITFGPCFSAEIANSTCNVLLETPVADRVIYQLKSDGIEARKWWNNGCHKEPVFKKCAREPLPMTELFNGKSCRITLFSRPLERRGFQYKRQYRVRNKRVVLASFGKCYRVNYVLRYFC